MTKTPKLSILCPALFCRRGSWPIVDSVRAQCEATEGKAEFIAIYDDGGISVGEKHNLLYDSARGEYVCTVADDDEVVEDYVATLLDAIGDTDVVTFDVDWNKAHGWNVSSCGMKPLAPVRREIALRFTFPDWWQSEDRVYAQWLNGQSVTVKHIDRVLYRYNYRPAKPEYGGGCYPPQGKFATPAAVQKHLRSMG